MAIEIEDLLKHLPVVLFFGIWIVGLLLRVLKKAGRASAPGSAAPPSQPAPRRLPGLRPQAPELEPTKFADERGYKPIEPR
jgi:hypothetical protein